MATEDLWNYSLTHYGSPGVAETCLRLQDDHGLDVNLVLCCLWFGARHGELSARQFDHLLAFSLDWSIHAVQPLRQVRRWIKRDFTALNLPETELTAFRNRVKHLELQAEHLQQDRLQAILATGVETPGPTGRPAMLANLGRYLARQTIAYDPAIESLIESLLDAVTQQN